MVWRYVVGGLDSRSLVFVDEMGAHTSLAPLYGYSTRGQRAFFKIPRNRGTNTTLLSSMSLERMGPSMAIEGSTTKEVFEAYIEHFLAPTLREGQVVVMDNLSAHKGGAVRKLIENGPHSVAPPIRGGPTDSAWLNSSASSRVFGPLYLGL